MYQALYRKWRPKTFDEVVGQEHITSILKAQIEQDRLSHAYLFIGTRGTGKTSCAKIMAKAVNCENPQNGNPCNSCPACTGIDSGAILDVEELDAASNNGVDNVRALREEAVFSPTAVKKRVYIIDEVHMLSNAAFNALLKILEEPPGHLMFILATTELHKVPATILSRCQRHSFRRLDSTVIGAQLSAVAAAEGLKLAEDASALLSRLADGSMRDALSLLDQCSGSEEISRQTVQSSMGIAGNDSISELLKALSDYDFERTLSMFDKLWTAGKNPYTILAELGTLLRDVLMMKIAPKGGRSLLRGGFDEDVLLAFSKALTKDWLVYAIDTLSSGLIERARYDNPRTGAELCLIGLCTPEYADGERALAARLSRLEEALASGELKVLEKPAVPAKGADVKTDDNPEKPDIPEVPDEPEKPDIPEVPDEPNQPNEPKAPDVPEPPQAEESAARTFSKSSDEMIKSLTSLLTKRFDAGTLTIFQNSRQSKLGMRDGHFIVYAETGLPFIILNNVSVIDIMRSAVSELFGAGISIKLEEVPTGSLIAPKPGAGGGLDTLSKFGGIVTFD